FGRAEKGSHLAFLFGLEIIDRMIGGFKLTASVVFVVVPEGIGDLRLRADAGLFVIEFFRLVEERIKQGERLLLCGGQGSLNLSFRLRCRWFLRLWLGLFLLR